MNQRRAKTLSMDGILTVGDGRGFLAQVRAPNLGVLVLTAAHCLPHLPPAHPYSHTEERTFDSLLGPLGEQPTIDAECLFVDPIADVAVLTSVDDQWRREAAEAYEHFVDGRSAFRLGAIRGRSAAWLLTLQNRWETCTLDVGAGGRALTLIDSHVVGGMSGSRPCLDHEYHGMVTSEPSRFVEVRQRLRASG